MKIFDFLSENFHFLVVKFSIYLKSRVVVIKFSGQSDLISDLRANLKRAQ